MSDLIDNRVIQQMIVDLGVSTCHQLVGLFIEELSASLADLEDAFKLMDLQKIEHVTHKLKNSAALYGALSVAAMAGDINTRLNLSPIQFTASDKQLLVLLQQTLTLYKEKYGNAKDNKKTGTFAC